MALFRRRRPELTLDRMFETRSHAWEQAGLAGQLSVEAAKKARREVIVLLPLLVGVVLAYTYRHRLFGLDLPIRVATVIALLAIGWAFARSLGQAAGPTFFRRMDPATAGTVGFLLRLATMCVTLLVALRIAGLRTQTLALGGTITAVVLGLAAQQTLGNVFAGTVLLSARPFRVGERIRMQAGALGGQVDGVVSSLGLLYVTLVEGDRQMMIPNSIALNAVVIPLREPDAVDLRARLRAGTRPSELQSAIEQALTVRTRSDPRISLEEVDGDEVVVRVEAAPDRPADGSKLADEILAAVGAFAADENGR